MADEVKAAADTLREFKACKSPFAYRGPGSPTEASIVLADAYLAELDETPPSTELLAPLGFIEKNGEWVINIPSARMVLFWVPSAVGPREPGDLPMPHTMGQVRTLLRVFGVSKGEKK